MIKIQQQDLDVLCQEAKTNPRRRKIRNFHNKPADTLQRMINALQSNTYCQPHRHITPVKREVFILLQGKAAVLEFNDQGNITDNIIMSKENGNYAVEITPRFWHTIIALQDNTAVYELKDGPYDPKTDKEFAPWAPSEEDTNAKEYLKSLLSQCK